MHKAKRKIRTLACGIFKREIEKLMKMGKLELSCEFLDSMLHMMPDVLEHQLAEKVSAADENDIILVYGDCQPRMFELQSRKNASRVSGINCCEIILGEKKYRELRSEGVFFLLPEWTARWQEVFQVRLGFNKENAQSFMGEMHSRLLYLDTGVIPVPLKAIGEISDFCGLPAEIVEVDLDHLLSVILDAIESLKESGNDVTT